MDYALLYLALDNSSFAAVHTSHESIQRTGNMAVG